MAPASEILQLCVGLSFGASGFEVPGVVTLTNYNFDAVDPKPLKRLRVYFAFSFRWSVVKDNSSDVKGPAGEDQYWM